MICPILLYLETISTIQFGDLCFFYLTIMTGLIWVTKEKNIQIMVEELRQIYELSNKLVWKDKEGETKKLPSIQGNINEVLPLVAMFSFFVLETINFANLFFSDNTKYFPQKIDKRTKKIVTLESAGSFCPKLTPTSPRAKINPLKMWSVKKYHFVAKKNKKWIFVIIFLFLWKLGDLENEIKQ